MQLKVCYSFFSQNGLIDTINIGSLYQIDTNDNAYLLTEKLCEDHIVHLYSGMKLMA